MPPNPSHRSLTVPAGSGSLLSRLRRLGYAPRADCGGEGTCGKCQVRLEADSSPPDPEELQLFSADQLAAGWRLACRISGDQSLSLELNPEWEVQFQLERWSPVEGLNSGLAVDIGTTGLVAALVDLQTGEPGLLARGYNPQRSWGADVMNRLVGAREVETLALLQQAIGRAIVSAFGVLRENSGFSASWFPSTTLAVGNTVMIHLAAGLPETTLSVHPFQSPLENQRTLSLQFDNLPLRLAGPIRSFIGSDLLAVLEYLRPHQQLTPALVMDLGTNSEIALWDGQNYWVTSCAAGPAFEGGGISCGASAGPEVATGVRVERRSYLLTPELEQPHRGLCGSALIALLAALRRRDDLAQDGKLKSAKSILLQETPLLQLTQKDVRELQLAKGALQAGLIILARRAALSLSQIKKVTITGAFARNLQAVDLQDIGLVHPEVHDIAFVNDGALRGAARALLRSEEPFAELRPLIRSINLVEESDFQELFLAGLALQPII